MARIVRDYENIYLDMDKEVVQIIETNDPKYTEGKKFNFIYLSYNDKLDKYILEFEFDNSHGKTDLHRRGKKDVIVDYGWKKAFEEFDKMVETYRKRKL